MELKVFFELPSDLRDEVSQFGLENFYTEEEKTPEHLANEKERFCSFPKAWLLVFEKDILVGRMMLHKRRVKFNKQDIILGGISGVCTRKNKRRQGIATMMIKEAVKILKKWRSDIAYLCANIEESGALYSQIGFVPLNRPYTYYGQSGRLYEEKNGMIAPINSTTMFEEVLNSKEKLHLGIGNW